MNNYDGPAHGSRRAAHGRRPIAAQTQWSKSILRLSGCVGGGSAHSTPPLRKSVFGRAQKNAPLGILVY
eukprot:scaffold8085_cov127-Isochrysis_galbana.AAC.11